jgi:hypothetical protein
MDVECRLTKTTGLFIVCFSCIKEKITKDIDNEIIIDNITIRIKALIAFNKLDSNYTVIKWELAFDSYLKDEINDEEMHQRILTSRDIRIKLVEMAKSKKSKSGKKQRK